MSTPKPETHNFQCNKCRSKDMDFSKHIHHGKSGKNTFHYKVHCHTCLASRYIPRSKEVFEIVKNQQWQTKTTRKLLRKKMKLAARQRKQLGMFSKKTAKQEPAYRTGDSWKQYVEKLFS